ncbi:MAG: iron-containing redox enzyme family protein [Gammaproteobacteria bacterium]|nr:iron-containing redox enzyme family protein [Gammaproteobacteria bacterium]
MEIFFKEHIRSLDAAIENFPWNNRSAYAQFLAQTYYYVAHSTRLLAVSASRFSIMQEDLHRRFIKHMSEEKGHHLIAEFDLKNLGLSLSLFPELSTTKAFYECQYYKSSYLDPITLFGYILALEGLSVTQGKFIHKQALESFGERATGFLRVHCEDDVEHIQSAFKHINQLNEGQTQMIKDNFHQTCTMYGIFLSEIVKASSRHEYDSIHKIVQDIPSKATA